MKKKGKSQAVSGENIDLIPLQISVTVENYARRAESCRKRAAVYDDYRDGKAKGITLRCNTLVCPDCAKRRRARIASKIRYFLVSHPNAYLITLTLKQGTHRIGEIMLFWKRLRARLWKIGVEFKFLLVREFTRKGTEHLHILVSRRLNIALVRKIWHEITGDSFVIDARKADEGAIGYLSKYLAKNCEHWREVVANRLRMFSHSVGLLLGQAKRIALGRVVAFCDSLAEAVRIADEMNTERAIESAMRFKPPSDTLATPLPF